MTSTDTSLVGALLDRRYRVDSLLARGGMSSVYRGTDTRLDRPVAIKIMDPRFADDPAFVRRFEREAQSAAKLHHPHVVAVHDYGVDKAADNGRAFLVMELVDGGTLRDLLNARGSLDAALALSVAEPVLSALAAAHEAGLVHRDIKPENVLIGSGGTQATGIVKVADFGLVRAVASSGSTSSSIILGTVAYLSPEQVTTGTASEPGDVYSAGILLYEMLTGKAPYVGDTAISVAYRHVNDDVPAPSTVAPGVPPVLDDLVLRATRRDPAARPANAGVFLHELQRIRAQLGIPSVTVPVPGREVPDAEKTMPAFAPVARTPQVPGPSGTRTFPRSAAQSPPSPPAAASPVAGPLSGRRRLIALWTAAVLLLGSVIGTGVWWFTGGPAGSQVTVPSIAGLDQAAAEKKLNDAGLNTKFTRSRDNRIAAGMVIRSDPASGASAERGSEVTVVVSDGKPTVPAIEPGTALADALTAIRGAQLEPKQDAKLDGFSSTVKQGAVLTVDPKPGTQLTVNATVRVGVSKGPPPLPVPNVVGLSQDEAFQKLRSAGFDPRLAGTEFSDKVDEGEVSRLDPAAGTELDGDNKQVNVFVSNGVEVPDVRGRTLDDAKKILSEAGLRVDVDSDDDDDNNGGGRNRFSFVVDQSPDPGKRVQKGSEVKLQVLAF